MERCPRCRKPVINDRGELHCLSCGELTHPDILARSRRWAAEEDAMLHGRLASGLRAQRKPSHDAPKVGAIEAAAMDELALEYADLPQEAWDKACNDNPAWTNDAAALLRRNLERARAKVEAGAFRPRAAEDEPEPRDPADPLQWLAWRIRHGLPISSELLETELGLNWRQAQDALAGPWPQLLETGAPA